MRYKTELKIKMTAYNKLKIAILAIIASQNIYAITIDPIQIQSAPGELLYAEMSFRQADPTAQIQASLATPDDITTLGVVHQPPGHLNFFTRRDGAGNGVITITSSRPLTDAELNIIIKIQEGKATRLQHIKTPLARSTASNKTRSSTNEKALNPISIVSEKEIALQLPESTQYQTEKQKKVSSQPFEAPLMLQQAAPPRLNTTVSAQANLPQPQALSTNQVIANKAATDKTTADKKDTLTMQKNTVSASVKLPQPHASADPLVRKYAEISAQDVAFKRVIPSKQSADKALEQSTVKPKIQASKPTGQPAHAPQNNQHVVQSNESLWAIASRVATAQNRPINEVMKQIQANNQHAFIQGDINRLRRGAALNLNSNLGAKEKFKVSTKIQAKIPQHQSGKAKYRLNQAEMSLVAEKEQDSASGSAKKNTEMNQTSNELSLKVMTSREKTVKLQSDVTQLEMGLRHKDHRIQLLNARLAQLQQQLKAQQVEKKPTH